MSVPPIIVDNLTIENLALDDIQFTLSTHPVLLLMIILTMLLLSSMIAHFTMLTYNSCKRYENRGNQTNLLNRNQADNYNFSRL